MNFHDIVTFSEKQINKQQQNKNKIRQTYKTKQNAHTHTHTHPTIHPPHPPKLCVKRGNTYIFDFLSTIRGQKWRLQMFYRQPSKDITIHLCYVPGWNNASLRFLALRGSGSEVFTLEPLMNFSNWPLTNYTKWKLAKRKRNFFALHIFYPFTKYHHHTPSPLSINFCFLFYAYIISRHIGNWILTKMKKLKENCCQSC